jgi:polar amino acid transport system permease protein
MFEWLFNPISQGMILEGLLVTVEITLFGVLLGLGLGTLLAIGDLYGNKPVKGLIAVYVEFFRGSPLLVQLFIAVYALPTLFSLQIDHAVVAFLVFGLNSAGYQKGYMKGAIETILGDQMQAGLSVGLSKAQTLRRIILPQAYRVVIPSWTNEFCSLTKSTAVLSIIGIQDLTGAGRSILVRTMEILPVWIFIAIIYLIWITAFSKIMDIIYEKKKIPGIELDMLS